MSGTYAGLFGLDAIYLAVGYALLHAVGLARFRLRDLQFAGLAYLAGWALMGVLLSLALMGGVPFGIATVLVTGGAVAVVCAAVARTRSGVLPPLPPRRWNAPAFAVSAVAGVVIAVGAAAALVTAFTSLWTPDFDVLTAWLPRANIVYALGGLAPSQWSTFIDPWYPPLVPVMDGTSFVFVGGFHPSLLPIQQVTLGLAFVLAALALLDRVTPRWISFPSLALLMVTPFFWWRLQSLLPDATLGYLLVAAAIVTLIWLHEPHNAFLALGAVFLAAATLAKLEGLIFSLLLAAVAIVAALLLRRRRGLPAVVLLSGPAATIPWHLWLDVHSVRGTNPDFNEPKLYDPSFLADRAGRFAHALWLIVKAPWGPEFRTTEALLLLGALVVVCVGRRIPVLVGATLAWLGLMVLALAATYATSRVALGSYFAFSAPRVGATFIVAAATLVPLLLGLALRTPAGARRPPS